MIKTLILKLTHRMWNREISRILCRAQGERLITSQQLHELAAAFDPSRDPPRHIVYGPRVFYGFRHPCGVGVARDQEGSHE
jgi:hypothetical protein